MCVFLELFFIKYFMYYHTINLWFFAERESIHETLQSWRAERFIES